MNAMNRKVTIPMRRYGKTSVPSAMKIAIKKYLKENPDARAIVRKLLKSMP